MIQTTDVQLTKLEEMARSQKEQGYRLVTMSCVELDETTVDILYHFDKDVELVNFRLTTSRNEPIPSISGVYLAAFLVENEIQDHFGLVFSGLAIDFGQTLMTEDCISTSYCKYSITRTDEPGKEAGTDG